ncbi:MAG: transcriptional repressor LexA [Anaerolineaceae bacterium]|nr:transcriptional repressor LexA [Anaerolineaceae bacterium]
MARKSAGMGERHHKIMRFLSKFQNENGYSPSIRQIGEAIGVKSTSLVDYYLKQLEEMGKIERDAHVSRSIRLITDVSADPTLAEDIKEALRKASDLFTIPIAGRIVASAPIPVPSSDVGYYDPESSVDIARSLLPKKEKLEDLFALEVEGDSMIDAMINSGDIIIMRHAKRARNGEMVAVWLDDSDETTLKYFYREGKRVRLQPANPTMDPIYIDQPENLRIMGKVVMVIRQIQGVAV